MRILDKVLHHTDEGAERRPADAESEIACPHTALTQHWEKLDDMGKAELAMYRCEACFAEFNAEEANLLMEQPPSVLVEAGVRVDDEKN